jgi:heptosyltransferase III
VCDETVELNLQSRMCPVCLTPQPPRAGAPAVTGWNYLHLGSLLGAFSLGAGLPALTEAPRVYIDARTRAAVDRLALPAAYVVLHAVSNDACKHWRREHWAELVRRLRAQRPDRGVVEVGQAGQAVLEAADLRVVNLCGRLSILAAAEVIRRAKLFVGIDSGPAHLANAVGTPGAVLLGPYCGFAHYQPFTGPFADGRGADLIYAEQAVAELAVDRVWACVAARLGAG